MDETKKKLLQALRDQGMYAPEDSALDAGAAGAVQGATAGYSDELGGAVEGLSKMAQGAPATDLGSNYIAGRDAIRKRLQELKESQPTAYNIGEGTGAMASMAIPGVTGAKGAMTLGGLAGLGRSDADLTQGQVGEAAKDAVVGAGIAGLGRFGGVMSTLRGAKAMNDERLKAGDQLSGRGAKVGNPKYTEAPIPPSINTNKTLPELKEKLKKIVNDSPDILRNSKLDDIKKQKLKQEIEKQKNEIEDLIEKKSEIERKNTTFI